MNLIIQAAALAQTAHSGQIRKWTQRPYIEHPMRVAGAVCMIPGVLEDVVAAAWLHDVLEDCPKYTKDVAELSGSVFEFVQDLTNRSKLPEHARKNRAERKKIDREYLAECHIWVQVVKLIDRLDNLREMSLGPADFKIKYHEESLLLAEALRPQISYGLGPGCDVRVSTAWHLCNEIVNEVEYQKFTDRRLGEPHDLDFIPRRMHPDYAKINGYIIDSHCYPWIAYKGDSFRPSEIHDCYTELESIFYRQRLETMP